MSKENLSSFDLDYRDGLIGEQLTDDVIKAIASGTIEVKTDRKWKDTGNLYVETECFYVKDNMWKPSGLNVTQANYWCFVLEENLLIVKTDLLKKTVRHKGRPIECNIPPNYSKGYLIKPEMILWDIKNDRL